MSTVGDAIDRATAAGIRAAQLAPLVNCQPQQRDAIRQRLVREGTGEARALRDELDARWRGLDAGRYGRAARS